MPSPLVQLSVNFLQQIWDLDEERTGDWQESITVAALRARFGFKCQTEAAATLNLQEFAATDIPVSHQGPSFKILKEFLKAVKEPPQVVCGVEGEKGRGNEAETY